MQGKSITMASPATKPLTLSATEPATALETLHRDRAGLADKLADLNRAAAKLRETSAAEAAVLAEIDALAAADVETMKAWAAGGCLGEAPKPDQSKRIVLGQQLNAAQAASAAAKGAGQDINNQIGELNNRLRNIESQIEKAALDDMQGEFSNLNAQHLAATEALRKVSAKMLGLCGYLANEGRRRIDNGDQEAGRVYHARAEALTSTKLANPGVTQGEIIRAADDWSRRAADLREGPAK
jgi:hypothetical protein